MLRRVLRLVLVTFCAGTLAANAQLVGGDASAPTADCSEPMSVSSPGCPASASGRSSYEENLPPQSQPNGTNSVAGNGGLPAQVAPYVDQVPYGNGMQGAYRNPYNPHAGANPQTPPSPPTEFQQVVAGATGARLPIFGADLFSAPFAPVDRTPVTSDYVVGPGDQLLIRVWGQVNLNVHATVDRAGDIYIPQVGDVEVAGLHFEQLNGYLKKELGRVFRNFDLSVNMGQLRSIQIYVVGNAQRPGSYTVSSLSTLVNALFSSGGPSAQGSMRSIELKRAGKIVTTFDLYNLLIRGDKSQDAPLLPGDVLYIPPVGPQIAVAGSVHTPAIYELKGSETAGQAIAMAGGLATMASKREAQLDRTNLQGARQTIQLSLDETGLQTTLRNGDILRVPSMVQRFDRTVTLRGNVANPGRYRWSPGMRILDLIPDQASLETRGYWQRRVALGLPAPEYTPLFSAYHADLLNPSERKNQQGSSAPKTYTTNTSIANTETQHIATEPSGEKTSQTSPSQHVQYSPPGDRFSQSQFPIKNGILRTAPSIDWSYAAIERTNPQTLATSLIPFHLGQAIIGRDASQNLKLDPGDVITVFSTADIRVPQAQQEKYVSVEGEVAHAGVYSVQPGETLRDLVRSAGGLTPDAYLYGSEFLRESTRRLQQAKLDAYANSMEKDIQLAAANLSGSVVNATAVSALGTSVKSQEALVATLRKIRATGRIVLGVTPDSRGVDALPDLPLQDGDRFIVPPVPATINVIGAVYDQNAFLYEPGRHVGDYLKMAGGSTRAADHRHEFVIRADGSVVSKQTAGGGLFRGGFTGKLSYPGDTVVVPDNVRKTTFLRNLTDYSTVLANFGLGAAAINLLK